jgi:mannan polymerase II complex MNN11 subunit
MQFALPPRRSPHLPVARSSRLPLYRKKQLKTVALFAFAVLSILYLLSHFYSSSTSLVAPAATTGVVIVTLLDHERFSESYLSKVVANREDYAKRHGKLIVHIYLLSIRNKSDMRQGIPTSSQASPTTTKPSATPPEAGLWSQPSAMPWPSTLPQNTSSI